MARAAQSIPKWNEIFARALFIRPRSPWRFAPGTPVQCGPQIHHGFGQLAQMLAVDGRIQGKSLAPILRRLRLGYVQDKILDYFSPGTASKRPPSGVATQPAGNTRRYSSMDLTS